MIWCVKMPFEREEQIHTRTIVSCVETSVSLSGKNDVDEMLDLEDCYQN